jgi:hypothetical protein
VLDDMPVTERAYHHLNYSLPLVASIVERAQRAANSGDKVLLIGGSALLGNALLRMGYDVDVWQFPQAFISDEMKPHVRRQISPAALAECDVPKSEYRLVIVPLVLESLPGRPEDFLRQLRKGISPDGTLIVATANQSRLEVRLAAIAGKRFATRKSAAALSLSWPALPTVREYHRDDLIDAGRQAGFRVRRCDYVTADRPFLEMEPMLIETYALRKGADLIRSVVPSTRGALVLELSPRVGERGDWKAGDQPKVSVLVSVVNGGVQLEDTLASLRQQTYPADLCEIILMHDGRRADVGRHIDSLRADGVFAVRDIVVGEVEGPHARNQAMAEAGGDISAHTDDASRLPPDWIEAAITRFDEDTAVVAGPVFAMAGSDPPFLDVPGLRPDPADKGIYREDLYPISNVFYRTDVALAAGGFSRTFSRNGSLPSAGWDAELPWRLQRTGWQTRFRQEVYAFRRFPAASGGWVPDQMKKAGELPRLYSTIPELGERTLTAGLFASRQTMYFDLMLAGAAAAAAKRRWPWLLLALPWLGLVSRRMDLWPPREWKDSAKMAAKIGALHLVWLGGFLKGSIKARRPVL